jgi:hypothetical protein
MMHNVKELRPSFPEPKIATSWLFIASRADGAEWD